MKNIFKKIITVIIVVQAMVGSILILPAQTEAAGVTQCDVSVNFLVNNKAVTSGDTIELKESDDNKVRVTINRNAKLHCYTTPIHWKLERVTQGQYDEGIPDTTILLGGPGVFNSGDTNPLVETYNQDDLYSGSFYTYLLTVANNSDFTEGFKRVDTKIKTGSSSSSADCWTLSLYQLDGKKTLDASTAKINFKDAQKYGIVAAFKCTKNFWYRGWYKVNGGTESKFLDPPEQGSSQLDKRYIPFGALSSEATITYRMDKSPNTNFSPWESKSVTVKFVKEKTSVTEKENDPTNTNTNTHVNNSKNNKDINTSVTATFDSKGLDHILGSFNNPLTKDTLPELLGTVLKILFALIGMVAVVIIMVAGFRMVMASGNEAELTKAKAAITWAIVGLIVSLMAFSIVAIIQRLISVGA